MQTLFSHKDARDARVRIVGQELGFLLLFAWDGCVGGKGEDRKTSIALLNLETNVQVVLYTHTEVTEVVAASVNHECSSPPISLDVCEPMDVFVNIHPIFLLNSPLGWAIGFAGTLLGFTTLMQYSNAESADAFEDVYESYLVEVSWSGHDSASFHKQLMLVGS